MEREPDNEHDTNAIAVYFFEQYEERTFFFRKRTMIKRYKIGYLKSSIAKSLAPKIDSGLKVEGYVSSFDFYDSNWPRVSLKLEY